MHTLLVDNYDSYTYNLHQLIAQVTGAEPTVLRHDDPALRGPDPDLSGFDNVVVSPGPGRPDHPGDLAHAAGLLAAPRLPTLGVCLGHQGIALTAGASVAPAPRPRHGHLTRIEHTGKDLFHGLPQHFTGVRYHSLCVADPLPLQLEATAWAEDGVVMGLRHRELPLWGVQFHPESICTEYGPELLANFARLTAEHHATRPTRRPVAPSPARRRAPAAPAARADRTPGPYRLRTRRLGTAVDTEAAFTTLYADRKHAFWLDSSRTAPGLSRFSFLGDAHGPLAEVVRYRAGTGTVEVTASDGTVTHTDGDIFSYLDNELARRHLPDPGTAFDFTCGYVGYFGYELRADLGSPTRHTPAEDDAAWIFADRLLVVDHTADETHLLCLYRPEDPEGMAGAERWLDRTEATLRALPAAPRLPEWPAPGTPAPGHRTEEVSARGEEQYTKDIAVCRDKLHEGESYEICLTDTLHVASAADALTAHLALRRANPAPYAAFLRLGGTEVVCSSPERFLRIRPDGTAETKPVKGTAPRGRTPDEDARLRRDLAADPKTRAENLMIVDLLRNDLGRVCEVGSVTVPRLMHVETYATVHQLVSTVAGTLTPGTTAVGALAACFPGGSMTGAPKLRTMEILDGLETEARGVYSGSLGYFGLAGGADLNIVIRTAIRTAGRWRVGAGGAIVLGSDPEEEYAEMLLKAAAPLRALLRPGAAGAPATHDPSIPDPKGSSTMLDARLLDLLACPLCKAALAPAPSGDSLVCTDTACARSYPVVDDIPVLTLPPADATTA
ncbi:aminodeoxychorismate synthase component I [Streptomyces platensis]|uniref:aminodeoxychorismate synthase component I n=1 Tax=Streptomyces platensis TaxID=58346 RepID=UPI0036901DCD